MPQPRHCFKSTHRRKRCNLLESLPSSQPVQSGSKTTGLAWVSAAFRPPSLKMASSWPQTFTIRSMTNRGSCTGTISSHASGTWPVIQTEIPGLIDTSKHMQSCMLSHSRIAGTNHRRHQSLNCLPGIHRACQRFLSRQTRKRTTNHGWAAFRTKTLSVALS